MDAEWFVGLALVMVAGILAAGIAVSVIALAAKGAWWLLTWVLAL